MSKGNLTLGVFIEIHEPITDATTSSYFLWKRLMENLKKDFPDVKLRLIYAAQDVNAKDLSISIDANLRMTDD